MLNRVYDATDRLLLSALLEHQGHHGELFDPAGCLSAGARRSLGACPPGEIDWVEDAVVSSWHAVMAALEASNRDVVPGDLVLTIVVEHLTGRACTLTSELRALAAGAVVLHEEGPELVDVVWARCLTGASY